MLPALQNKAQEAITICRKSFSDRLCEEYRFDIKTAEISAGTRFLFYYQDEHSLLVSHTDNGKVHVINLMTGKIRWFDHHGTTVRSVMVFNHKIITASWDGTVCITDFNSLTLQMVLTEKTMGRCSQAILSPDFRFAYSYSYDSDKDPACTSNTVREWLLADGSLNRIISLPGDHLRSRRCGSCMIYRGTLYAVSNSGYFHAIDCATGKIIHENLYNEELQTLCAVPSKQMIFIVGNKGNIYQFDASKHKLIRIVKANQEKIMDIMGHPEKEDILFTVGYDGTLKIWQLPGLEMLFSTEVENSCLWSTATGGNMLITAGVGGALWIYDIRDPRNIIPKGKIHVLDQSYAYISENFKSFYTSDPGLINVVKINTNEPAEQQFGQYLTNSLNNLNVIRDLFGLKGPENRPSGNSTQEMFQLSESFCEPIELKL